MNETWYVAHTKPRREKKLAEYCQRESIAATLPCYRTIHRYRGKTVAFSKPLFPNYVFLKLRPEQRQRVLQNDHVANLLVVPDQEEFERQLDNIVRALQSDAEVRLAPHLSEGTRVRVKTGPLRGLEGVVETRQGVTQILLRLDFIAQAAAVQVDAAQLEPV
jgi:transcription antitermination factor NusG